MLKNRLLALLLALGLSSSFFVGNAGAEALQLENGWTPYSPDTGRPEVFLADGIVSFKGAIANGTNAVAFTLPAAMRPATDVYVAIDLCNVAPGRLLIQPSGEVSVQFSTTFADAQCFSSLDGAMFAPSATGFTALTPVNSWSGAPFGTSSPAAALINGIVYFKGAVSGGLGSPPLHAAYRAASRDGRLSAHQPVGRCEGTPSNPSDGRGERRRGLRSIVRRPGIYLARRRHVRPVRERVLGSDPDERLGRLSVRDEHSYRFADRRQRAFEGRDLLPERMRRPSRFGPCCVRPRLSTSRSTFAAARRGGWSSSRTGEVTISSPKRVLRRAVLHVPRRGSVRRVAERIHGAVSGRRLDQLWRRDADGGNCVVRRHRALPRCDLERREPM